jgi:uncharacterized protein
MKLLVDRIKDSPAEHRFEANEAWCEETRGVVPELAEPPVVELRAHRMGSDLYLEGVVRAGLDLECSRCLARYRLALREPFRLVLEPAGARVPSEPEAARQLARLGMCLGDELEMGWYQGSEIDLGGFVRELVALAPPVQPLCREQCRGLCPHCGVDRNIERCACEEQRPASPFAALAALRGGGKGGG